MYRIILDCGELWWYIAVSLKKKKKIKKIQKTKDLFLRIYSYKREVSNVLIW